MLVLPTLQSMLDLYGSGMALVLESRAFLRQVELLKRLSLNAEIQAIHSGEEGVVFQTIARELGLVTGEARGVLAELMQAAEIVSQSAVQTAALARLCEKYQAACGMPLGPETALAIKTRLDQVGRQILDRIREIGNSLTSASSALRDLERLGVKLPMIATLLRIEAHRQPQVHQALASNALELMDLKTTLTALLGKVQHRTQETMAMLSGHALAH